MRTKNALKNSLIAVMAQITTMILSFVNRKVFVIFLNIEMLGYESLFSNIFSLLSMADMGIGNIITFHLYKEIAEDNKNEIKKLMAMYRFMFRVVAVAIAVLGIGMIFFLPFVIKNDVSDWTFVNKIYLLQLFGIVSSYFLSYRRTIFIADQKEYKCITIDVVGRLLLQICQILILAVTKDFLLYLSVKIIINIIINMIVYMMSNQIYPYLKDKIEVTKNDFLNRNIFKDTKDFLVHKLATTVFNGTDNIIISSLLGVKSVALFGNYYMLENSVVTLFVFKVLSPVRASIGNLIYSNEDTEKQIRLFNMFNYIGFVLASFISICFLFLYQDFMKLWMGEEYLLPFSFVVIQSLAVYVQVVFEILYMYRCAYGNYEYDKKYMIYAAVLNIVLSVIFVNFWGITGIRVGTLVALMSIIYGRGRFVFATMQFLSSKKYLVTQGKYALIFIISCFVTYMCVCNIQGGDIISFIIKAFLCVLIPNILSVVFFFKSEEQRSIFKYIGIVKNK